VSLCPQFRDGTANELPGAVDSRFTMMRRLSVASRSCVLVRLSKIEDYLIDNLCVSILSEWSACGQDEKRAGRGPGSKLGISLDSMSS
jgi:hypothetical protein